ncbi:MAG: tetratricopeptide repeat protein [Leptospiraceae bacterium]|nr:tetratricopeptide repeat protein [Leptospiraceae bacterium]MCK6382356.1 tetratricopeptide repeat protein [Leptospiraceae bacterium]NUM41446.1 tetratricopeptide repeat protein [Leptospiraceae bacterium]
MAGPTLRTYKGGSIVYFEKDKSEDIYVLQSGRVILTYSTVDNKHEIKEDVRIGEFFGVKSSLGHYPREETAQVIGGAVVLVFKPAEFESFVMNKTHLILKMLKVFSSQLRQIHRQVRELLGQGDAKMPAYELMNVAEVFYKSNNLDYAIYAFERYLAHYPQGKYSGRATELLSLARKGSAYPFNMPELVYEVDKSHNSQNDLEHILNTPAEVPKPKGSEDLSISALFNKAHTYAKAGKNSEAAEIFKSLTSRIDIKNPTEKRDQENAHFHLGECYFHLNQFDTAFSTLSNYVRNFPRGEMIKESIFTLAKISEAQSDNAKAAMLYGKVASMAPNDDMTAQALKKVKELKT